MNNAYFTSFFEFLKRIGVVIGLLLVVLILSFSTHNFLTMSNILNVLRQISVISILSVGMTFVILSGGIDLSVGSLVAFTGVVSASILTKGHLVSGIIAGIALGYLLGLISGLFIAYGRVPSFVATLGMMAIARSLTLVYTGGETIGNFPKSFLFIGKGYTPILISIAIYAMSYFILMNTRLGRYTYALGSNEEAARLSGIKVKVVKLQLFGICGFTAGIGGLMNIARLQAANAELGFNFELDAIAAVVIGGTSLSGGEGSIIKTFVGALLIGIIQNGLNLLNVNPFWQKTVIGLVIIFAVLIDQLFKKSYNEK